MTSTRSLIADLEGRLAEEAERLVEPADPARVARAIDAAHSASMGFEREPRGRWRAALPLLAAASLLLAVGFLVMMHSRPGPAAQPSPAADPVEQFVNAFDGVHTPDRLVAPLDGVQRLASLATPSGLATGAQAFWSDGVRLAEHLPIAQPIRLLRDAAAALRRAETSQPPVDPTPAPTGA